MASPQLAYYFGRRVAEIRPATDEEPDAWQIILDPAVYIRNLAVDNEQPSGIIGAAFLSGTGLDADTDAILQFGFSNAPTDENPDGSVTITGTVTFPPKGYEIQDADLDENYVNPDEPVTAEDTLPPDPSGERVADGPE
jgi:hypothetical protein